MYKIQPAGRSSSARVKIEEFLKKKLCRRNLNKNKNLLTSLGLEPAVISMEG